MRGRARGGRLPRNRTDLNYPVVCSLVELLEYGGERVDALERVGLREDDHVADSVLLERSKEVGELLRGSAHRFRNKVAEARHPVRSGLRPRKVGDDANRARERGWVAPEARTGGVDAALRGRKIVDRVREPVPEVAVLRNETEHPRAVGLSSDHDRWPLWARPAWTKLAALQPIPLPFEVGLTGAQ